MYRKQGNRDRRSSYLKCLWLRLRKSGDQAPEAFVEESVVGLRGAFRGSRRPLELPSRSEAGEVRLRYGSQVARAASLWKC